MSDATSLILALEGDIDRCLGASVPRHRPWLRAMRSSEPLAGAVGGLVLLRSVSSTG